MSYNERGIGEIPDAMNWEGTRVYLSGAFVSVLGGASKKSNRFGATSVICEYLVSHKATIRRQISRRLSKNDNILIIGKNPGAVKIERAKKWRIKIYTEKNMLRHMGLVPTKYVFADGNKDAIKSQSRIVIRDKITPP